MKTSSPLRAALLALLDGDKMPHELYAPMFPSGRFNIDVDCGSSKGGPSRSECAVNWYLGKHARDLVRRRINEISGRAVSLGAYTLTAEGRTFARSLIDR